MTFVRLEPGFVSSHKHLQEQMGYILSGEIELAIDEERMKCESGDGYVILAGYAYRVYYPLTKCISSGQRLHRLRAGAFCQKWRDTNELRRQGRIVDHL